MSWTYGDTVVYSCDVLYQHTAGNLVRTCEASGQWSGEPPTCTGKHIGNSELGRDCVDLIT